MRQANPDKQAAVFASPFLDRVGLIVIPHTEAEFGYRLPVALERRSAFVGPIVRLPIRSRQARARARYGIRPGDFVLTSTVGGGGSASGIFGTCSGASTPARRLSSFSVMPVPARPA